MYINTLTLILFFPVFSCEFRIKCVKPNLFSSHSILDNEVKDLSQNKLTVGIEAHVQLSLFNKLFCKCETLETDSPLLAQISEKIRNFEKIDKNEDFIDFHEYFLKNHNDFISQLEEGKQIDEVVNKNACEVCTGEPGAYGRLNPYAVPMAVIASRVLNCKNVSKDIVFHRKTYEYFDLPKQYQLSQCRVPMATDGYIDVEGFGQVFIKQIHLEEDTAKRIPGEDQLLDYNRSGVCLLEVVTEPISATSDDIVNICKEIQKLLKCSRLSRCKMHKSNLRFDINISSTGLDRIVEVKNLNSFERIRLALDKVHKYGSKSIVSNDVQYEIDDKMREYLEYAKTHSPIIESRKNVVTALWNGKDDFNVARAKSNYLYIQDWTIQPIKISKALVESIAEIVTPKNYFNTPKRAVPFEKYPTVKPNLLSSIYKSPPLSQFFESSSSRCDPAILSTLFVQVYLKMCRIKGVDPLNTKLTSEKFAKLVNLIQDGEINMLQAKSAIETLALIWEGEVEDVFDLRQFIVLNYYDTKFLVDEFINSSPVRLLKLITDTNGYSRTVYKEISNRNLGIPDPKLVFDYCNELVKTEKANIELDEN